MTEIKDIPEVQLPDPCGCETKHPLERDGTSQAQRLLAALDPESVSVDERTLEDLLLFAKNYAKLLNYYKPGKTNAIPDGDWEIFLKKDISVLIAVASKTDTKSTRKKFNTILVALRNSTVAANDEIIFLLGIFKEILTELNSWYADSDATTLFRRDLAVYFQSMILDSYLKLVAFEQAAGQNVVTGFSFTSDWQNLVNGSIAVIDNSLYTGVTQADKNKSAANTLQSIFEKFISTLQIICNRTPLYLEKSIEEYPFHKAHMGLFITFLELFGYAQKHINGITERHLDFFYQEVLQLAPKKAIADKVHVIFELAKNATEKYKVPENTQLKAGKDAKGVELLYGTDEDIIVNKATVAQFRNIFIDSVSVTSGNKTTISSTGIYASPVANSSDGKGGELDKTVPQWKAFGSAQKDLEYAEHTMPDATIGFAVSSPQLFLAEGDRTISVIITLEKELDLSGANGIMLADFQKKENFRISVTGAKKWVVVDEDPGAITGSIFYIVPRTLVFTVNFSPVVQAIVAHDPKLHGGTYSTENPLLKIEFLNFLKQGTSKPWNNVYGTLKNAVVTKIEIGLIISGMHNLTLHNEFAKIDPAKPFMPFGSSPVIGSPLFIGSKEIFFKQVDTLTLKIDWHGAPKSFTEHYANYVYDKPAIGNNNTVTNTDVTPTISNTLFEGKNELLEDNKWNKALDFYTTTATHITPVKNKLFDESDANEPVTLSFTTVTAKRSTSADAFNENLIGSSRGYIRIALNGTDFLHKIYPMALAKQALKGTNGKIPVAPYTPVIKSFSAGYTSKQVLDTEFDQFYHIHPFGEAKLNTMPGDKNAKAPLAPQFLADAFNAQTNAIEKNREQSAMLFIGIENLVPQESLSLLVQVVEDSGSHDVKPPLINWSYLSSDEWIGFTAQEVISDTSNGFLTSGIIELNVPEAATKENTTLPSGYHWLRASVVNEPGYDSSALCNVLNIIAQAVQASFRDQGNDPLHLASSLAAKTIAKFSEPDPSVKSVTQPYGSFGGRMAEQGNDYYRRVSERLRHKGRGITIWDYERLVLENFPSIYKVKCISHTRDVTGNKKCYSELAPGNVCLTVVSNLRNQNEVDKLKPTTSINTRDEIQKFLKKRTSKFAAITVINPDYEMIQAKCKVTYLPEFEKDKGYYDNVLIEDIKKFLSPWAYDEGFDIVFGGKIHSSYIINFIEERFYVDFLTDFEMTKIKADDYGKYTITETAEELSASFAKTILVSADTHLINKDA
jgi:hypothetical protein